MILCFKKLIIENHQKHKGKFRLFFDVLDPRGVSVGCEVKRLTLAQNRNHYSKASCRNPGDEESSVRMTPPADC